MSGGDDKMQDLIMSVSEALVNDMRMERTSESYGMYISRASRKENGPCVMKAGKCLQ